MPEKALPRNETESGWLYQPFESGGRDAIGGRRRVRDLDADRVRLRRSLARSPARSRCTRPSGPVGVEQSAQRRADMATRPIGAGPPPRTERRVRRTSRRRRSAWTVPLYTWRDVVRRRRSDTYQEHSDHHEDPDQRKPVPPRNQADRPCQSSCNRVRRRSSARLATTSVPSARALNSSSIPSGRAAFVAATASSGSRGRSRRFHQRQHKRLCRGRGLMRRSRPGLVGVIGSGPVPRRYRCRDRSYRRGMGVVRRRPRCRERAGRPGRRGRRRL